MSGDGDITWFFVTGFPKSGNKWFQKMLFSFDSVGGFNNRPERGLPLLATSLVENRPLARLLRSEGVSFESFVKRLYHPGCTISLAWSDSSLPSLRDVIAGLTAHSKKMSRGRATDAQYQHLLDSSAATQSPHERWRAVGLPGMHTPIAQVQRLLPSFRIVHLLRDPRDVIVSYFYHQISTLTEETALELVRVGGGGQVEMRPRWRRPFARRIGRRLRKYYGKSMVQTGTILRLRYEELLAEGAPQVTRVLQFLNVNEPPERVEQVLSRHSFEKRTGSVSEQRSSLRRKGQSGDWRNYFDRELLDELGSSFIDLVTDLGYESDSSWTKDVPEQASRPWEFSRFRIKRSTLRQFIRCWEQSPDLRAAYPDPWDLEGADSFYEWLRRCDRKDVRRWFELALQLEELWRVDVVETKPLRGKARRARNRTTERRRARQARS